MIQETFFNDLILLPTYGFLLAVAFVTLIIAIWFHELGHAFYFKSKLKKNIKVRFMFENIWKFKWLAGEQADYENLTDRQYHDVNMFGVLAGFIPIILIGIFLPLMLLIAIPYLAGCIGDLQRMQESIPIIESDNDK